MKESSLSRVAAMFVGNHMLLLLLLAGGIGALLPGAALSLSSWVPLDLAIMIAALGMTIPLGRLTPAGRDLLSVGALLVGQIVALPVLGWALAHWLAGPVLGGGMMAVALAPAEITSGAMTMLAGGDVLLAVRLMAGSLALSVVTIPFGLSILVSVPIASPPVAIFQELLLVVLLPFLAGSLLRQRVGKLQFYEAELGAVSAVAVIVLVFVVASGLRSSAAGQAWLSIILACLAFNLLGLLVGWLVSRWLHLLPPQRRAAMLSTGMREFGIATSMAIIFLPPGAAAVPAIYGLIMLLTAAVAVRWIRRQTPAWGPGPGEQF